VVDDDDDDEAVANGAYLFLVFDFEQKLEREEEKKGLDYYIV